MPGVVASLVLVGGSPDAPSLRRSCHGCRVGSSPCGRSPPRRLLHQRTWSHGSWLPGAELVNQRLVGSVVGEGANHVGIGEFISLLGEPPDVVPEAFPTLLDALLEAPRGPRAFAGTLEITHEGLFKVSLVVDSVTRQVHEPGPRPLCEVDREKLDDHVIILESCHAAGKAVVFQPDAGIGGHVVLVHVCWYVRFYGKLLLLDRTLEGAWSWPRSARTTLTSPLGMHVSALLFISHVAGC